MERNEYMSLGQVSDLLQVAPYRIGYAIDVGLVAEPALRVAHRRIFQQEDVRRLATHFGIDLSTEEVQAAGG